MKLPCRRFFSLAAFGAVAMQRSRGSMGASLSAMRAWIDRTHDGLSGILGDDISLPLKKRDFDTSRWQLGG